MRKIKQFTPPKTSPDRKFNGRAEIDALYKTQSWIVFSKKFLSVNRRCYACGLPSTATDHLYAHKGDKSLFEKIDNVIPLCNKCHNTVTAKFDRHFVQKINEKLQWLQAHREIKELTFKVMVVPWPRG